MKSFLPVSILSFFLVHFLSSSTLANWLPLPANPQLDFPSEPEPNVDFLLPQQEEQQRFPLGDATTRSNPLLLLLPPPENNLNNNLNNNNNNNNDNEQPTTSPIPPPPAGHDCNPILHPRSDDSSTAEPAMCHIHTDETFYPVPDWDPFEEWKEYLRKYPPAGPRVSLKEEEEEKERNRALKDESVGTRCPDPYHQDHLCCAGPEGKRGVLLTRPNDISYIERCAAFIYICVLSYNVCCSSSDAIKSIGYQCIPAVGVSE